MPNGTSEVVKFQLPDGSIQPFEIPAGLSDTDARSFVLSKRPDLFHTPEKAPPFLDAANQAKKQITSLPMQPSALGGAHPTTEQEQYIDQRLPMVQGRVSDIRKQALSAAGASFGMGSVAGGSGLLPALLRMGGAGAGAAAGNVAGAAIGGQKPDPQEALATGAGFAAGEGASQLAVAPFLKWLTASKSVGAKLLQAAASKAGNAPVELSPQTNEVVDKIVQQGKLGGSVPKVISDLLERVGPSTRQAADANPGPLTYEEARVLQSNASDSSVSEKLNLNKKLKGLMASFANSFSKDVQAAADQAGVGAEHSLGMKEYAQASARNAVAKNVAKLGATGVGLYGGYRELQSLKK